MIVFFFSNFLKVEHHSTQNVSIWVNTFGKKIKIFYLNLNLVWSNFQCHLFFEKVPMVHWPWKCIAFYTVQLTENTSVVLGDARLDIHGSEVSVVKNYLQVLRLFSIISFKFQTHHLNLRCSNHRQACPLPLPSNWRLSGTRVRD